ncbi:2Fe-2S iron-sulfur cluster-binding protein [Paeniroseomonas aquatica]|uniref:2Fe-2S iron-sulfur cluster-binding protein n=1 Tax=Paeniroseomonas aquatica TaxID=373043 RepID=UPI0036151EB8
MPWPHLRYGCGMGKCAKCACRVIGGAEHLPAPNWKEEKQLGGRIAEGYRLVCQIWLTHDVSLVQDDVPLPPRGCEARPGRRYPPVGRGASDPALFL